MSTYSQYYKNILIDLHSAVIGDNDHNGKLCKEHSEEKGP